jgi:tubulin monoglycylase TTLL3/8
LINSKRKFDFRQWVLVLSWDPLDVLVFDACYLKICSSDFDLIEYQDILRHLSNYSLQKGDSKKELVMSSDEFA